MKYIKFTSGFLAVFLIGCFVGFKHFERESLKLNWNLRLLDSIGDGLIKVRALELINSGRSSEAANFLERYLEIDEAAAIAYVADPHLANEENIAKYKKFVADLEAYRLTK